MFDFLIVISKLSIEYSFSGSRVHILDFLSIPNETITLILCGNSLQSKNNEWKNQLPDNVVIAHYGFQVNHHEKMIATNYQC